MTNPAAFENRAPAPLPEARTLSVGVRLSAEAAYERMWSPASFPVWAEQLGTQVDVTLDGWVAATSSGPLKVHFTERNHFGVLDHRIVLPGGRRVDVPLRVVPCGRDCVVLLTLLTASHAGDAAGFAAAEARAERDLQALKAWLEADRA